MFILRWVFFFFICYLYELVESFCYLIERLRIVIMITIVIIIYFNMKNERRKTPTNFMCLQIFGFNNLLQALFNFNNIISSSIFIRTDLMFRSFKLRFHFPRTRVLSPPVTI